MRKNIFILLGSFTFLCFFIIDFVFADEIKLLPACKHSSEINECFSARKNGTTRTINDYICPQSVNREQSIYQIILDKKFRIIDKEAENYLGNLEKSKDFCFGPNRQKDYVSCITDIDSTFSELADGMLFKRYADLCKPNYEESIVSEFLSCVKGSNVVETKLYFPESDCERLIKYKLSTYKQVGFNVLKQNKIQILKDFRKKQFQNTRTKYDGVIDALVQNLDFISRINNMWNGKTKNPVSK